MAGSYLDQFLRNGRVQTAIPVGVGLLDAAGQLGDSNDNPMGNAVDSAGSLVGGLVGGFGARTLAAAIPPTTPYSALLKAGLMLASSEVGSKIGSGLTRPIADWITNGATSNIPEEKLFRFQQRAYDQKHNQEMRDIKDMLPIQEQQAKQAYELDELARKAEFERMTAAGLQNNLWQSALASSARGSDMMANTLNSVLHS
jgi:hypothetical protein